jgi:signal transduction histidine kinase
MFFLITALLTAEVRTRQRTEAALREHDNILGSILNSMGDGVIVVSGDGRILVFNPAAEKLLGANAIGRNARQWAVETDALLAEGGGGEATRHGPLSLAVSGRGSSVTEFPVRSSDDEENLILGLTVLPLEAYGNKPAGVAVVVANLTAKRSLEKKIAEASERVQRRIGRDLHDGVCQHLVGVAFAAGTLQSSLEDIPLPREAAAAGEIAALINDAITEARNLAHGLYPASLNEGIAMALMSLAGTTGARTGIHTEANIADSLPLPNPVTSTHLYRIAQEAVSNACRHAAPKLIHISLNSTGEQLRLVVEDDGRGFDSSIQTSGGIGLNLMRHRAALLGGTIEIDTNPGSGTRVTCFIPANHSSLA